MKLLSKSDAPCRLISGAGAPARSTGNIHVSDVIRRIAIALGYLKTGQDDADEFESHEEWEASLPREAMLAMAAGLAWEEYLARVYEGQVEFHPGEVEKDGISGSPDGLCWAENEVPGSLRLVVAEFKYSEKSSNNEPIGPDGKPTPKWWMWLTQVMCYCHMLDTTRADFYVYHVRGDYRERRKQFLKYEFEFTKAELEGNWKMIMREARAMEKEKQEAMEAIEAEETE